MPAWRKLFAAAAGLVLCAGASFAGVWAGYVRAPLVRPPAPTGRHPIGTVALQLGASGTGAALDLQIWYPATPGARGATAPYLLRAKRSLRVRLLGALIDTDAVVDARVAAGRFPIVISVPGWGGKRENNTARAQDLASNGYVVVAMDDPYPAVAMDFSSDVARRRTIAWSDRKVRMEASDVERIVRFLAELDRAPKGGFARHLDLERIGLLGFSFGGAVAAEAALSDARFAAIVNLDGWLFGQALRAGVARPMLVISAPLATAHAAPSRYPNEAARVLDTFDRENEELQLEGLRAHGGFLVTIDGTDHYNFTDAAWLPSLRRTGLGTIDGRRGSAIVTAYVRQFFDRTLKHRSAPLFDAVERPDAAARLLTFR